VQKHTNHFFASFRYTLALALKILDFSSTPSSGEEKIKSFELIKFTYSKQKFDFFFVHGFHLCLRSGVAFVFHRKCQPPLESNVTKVWRSFSSNLMRQNVGRR
jgi:hypothetical protein